MAALSLHPLITSFLSHKPLFSPPPSIIRYPLQRRFLLRASSIKKPGAKRKVKSDQELCSDLREFVSVVGLPEGHIPSMKELSQHGRRDLANIVRRKGYKYIKDLLSTTTKTDINEFNVEESLTENQDVTCDYEDVLTSEDEKVQGLVEDFPLSSKESIMESYVINANTDPAFNYFWQSCIVESSMHSLQEKAAKFVKDGELDTIKDNDYGILNGAVTEEGKGATDSKNKIELESQFLTELHIQRDLSESNTDEILNENASISGQSVPPRTTNYHIRDGQLSSDELVRDNLDKDLGIETGEGRNQAEVDRLKLMLHQRELELSQFNKQIEKEKLALAILQTKAETEISRAQKLILEKDAELNAAEESLSELKEVQIHYSGNGEIVEVAGSFNGWTHPIKMDLELSSNSKEHLGPRKSTLWSTVLWLYPGLYEIKFIIDGRWRIDPEMETVARGNLLNNILRVDR